MIEAAVAAAARTLLLPHRDNGMIGSLSHAQSSAPHPERGILSVFTDDASGMRKGSQSAVATNGSGCITPPAVTSSMSRLPAHASATACSPPNVFVCRNSTSKVDIPAFELPPAHSSPVKHAQPPADTSVRHRSVSPSNTPLAHEFRRRRQSLTNHSVSSATGSSYIVDRHPGMYVGHSPRFRPPAFQHVASMLPGRSHALTLHTVPRSTG